MKKEPAEHQKKALEYLHRRYAEKCENSAYLLMEMRMGKTLPTVLFLAQVQEFPVMLIMPPTIWEGWLEDIREILPDKEIVLFQGTKKKKTKIAETFSGDILFASYTGVMDYKLDTRVKPKIIVMDELYILGNIKSTRTYWYTNIRWECFRIGLCGNPTPEGTMYPLVTMFFATAGKIGKYEAPYEFLVDNTEVGREGKLHLTGHAEKYLEKLMGEEAFCATRKEWDIGGEKIWMRRRLPQLMPDKYKKIADGSKNTYIDRDGVEKQLTRSVRFMFMQAYCSGIDPETRSMKDNAKIGEVLNLLGTEFKGKQVVVFCKFLVELSEYAKQLRMKGYKCVAVSGKTLRDDQVKYEHLFRTHQAQVAILQEDKCKYGLDFSEADVLIYSSNSMSGDARKQSSDRGIHPKKKKTILILDLITHTGVDGLIATMVQDKNMNAAKILQEASTRGII